MAAKRVYVEGKCKWARTQTPDPWGNYKITLYPTPESLEKIRELGLKNTLKKDEEGYNVTFRRPTSKLMRGKITTFAPPIMLDIEGNPLYDVMIGNGSDVTLRLEVYDYTHPVGGKGTAARLAAIRVDNLVPFQKERDFEEDQQIQVGDLDKQPPQLF